MVAYNSDYKRGVFWFLMTSILITVAFRWPTTYHETGVDSFYIHGLANSAAQFGDMRWVVNPLSLFGLYPLSYASGVPIMLAEFSNMTGMTMEETILIFSFLTAIIAALTSFLLALEIRNSAPFAFTISTLYAACPILLFSTQWTTGTRGMFMALLPFALWILVRLGRIEHKAFEAGNKRWLVMLLIATLFLMAIIHSLFFMMIIFIIAYYVTKRVLRLIGSQKGYFVSKKTSKRFTNTMITFFPIMIATAMILILANSTGWLAFESFQTGLFEGGSILDSFLNAMVPIAATLGFPIALLFPVSLFLILKSKRKDFVGIFFVISFLFILPFSGGRTYEKWLYPILLAILILLPVYIIISSKNRKRYATVALIALMLTLPMNLLVLDNYNNWPETKVINDGISTPDHVYMTAIYYGNGFNGEPFTTNNYILSSHIQAYTNCPQITTDVTNLIIFRIIKEDEIGVELNSIEQILSNKGDLYSSPWQEIMYFDYAILLLEMNGPAEANDLLTKYNIHSFIEDTRLDGKFVGYAGGTVYPRGANTAPFIDGMHNTTYKIYDNGIDIIWYIRQ
jgi:hypothetical protein